MWMGTIKLTVRQRPEKWSDMTDNAKPAFVGTSESPCSARDRFTLDPESGFVFDRYATDWMTSAEEVFDALSPLLPNTNFQAGGTL